MPAYQVQDSALTLAEGLAEYYASHALLTRGETLSADAAAFFRCHDVAHVVFGCDVSLPQEAVVKLSSLFGTTGGLAVLRGYALYESIDIYRQLRLGEIITTLLASTILAPRTLIRCARQTRRWPWSGHDEFMDCALRDIRAEFGIQV